MCEPRFKATEPTPRIRFGVGFFNWIPAGQELWCFADGVQTLRDLHLTFDMETLINIMGDEFDYSRLFEPQILVYEPRVTSCARLIADLCIESLPDDQLYAESLLVALLASLLVAISKNRPLAEAKAGLTPWQLRIAKDYLRENFNQAVSLLELAGLTGLSRSWFARAFKESTGVAPYQWMLQFRIEKAKGLLRNSAIPIVEIATQVGFADQSHFTKLFRRFTGTTPREWRNDQIR
jgi:AraC family transcriptional regulator